MHQLINFERVKTPGNSCLHILVTRILWVKGYSLKCSSGTRASTALSPKEMCAICKADLHYYANAYVYNAQCKC